MSYLQSPFPNINSLRAIISTIGIWLAMLLPTAIFGQDDLNVHGVVSDAMTSSKLSDVKVTVKKNGAVHDSFTTRANGKYEFYLDCDSRYEFVFEKPDFVKRTIIIDSKNIPQEVIGAGIIMPTDMSMYEITEAMKDQDLSVFDAPIGKASYDGAQGDLVWDFDHTNKVKSDIMSFMRDVEKRQKDLDKEASAADKAADENEEKFKQLIKDGETAMSKEKYQDAVLNFKAALEIKPEDLPTKGKLGDAETKFNAQEAKAKLDSDYSAALDAGDGFMRTEEFQKAVDKYNEALGLKPNEQYPTDQIAAATKIMEDRAANMEKQEAFDALMAEGEKLFKEAEYVESLAKYTEAKTVFPENSEVERKIEEVNEAIANEEAIAAKKAVYDGYIASADEKFSAENYEEALIDYKSANQTLPEEAYAVERIAASEAKISALANQAEKQVAFDALIADGDAAMTAAEYQVAIDKFKEALTIFSKDATAKSKLSDAESIFGEKQAAKEKLENYNALIVEADNLYKDENLPSAKAKYEEARSVFQEEVYPLDQITKIDVKLKELAASAEAQEIYDVAMVAGNSAVESEKYDDAINQFQAALGAKANDKDATEALENAQTLKKQYDSNQEIELAYSEKLSEADSKMANEAFAEARTAYTEAQQIKPNESYPPSQIELIDAALAERAANAEKAAEVEALQAEYQGYLDAGDAALGEEDFAEAISRYEDALMVKEGDVIAEAKLEEARVAQKARQQASAIDEQYAEWITRADEKLGESALQDALTAYGEAVALKDEEVYPKNQIKLIEERIAAEEIAAAEAEASAKIEQVNALILEGDNLVREDAFENGIVKYNEALSLLPKRGDIQLKIDAAMSKMLEFQEAAGIEEAYTDAVADADSQFGLNNWQRAKAGYEAALKIKPGEEYPQKQLTDITAKMEAEEAAADSERQKLVQEEFDDFIKDGDKSFKKKRYEDALGQYEDALALIPTSEIALEKIGEVNQLLGAMDEEIAEQEAYEKLIAAGDDLFNETSYEMARLKFLDAQELKPEEKYPSKKIQEIDIQLEKLRLEQLANDAEAVDQEYRAKIKSGDALVIEEDYSAAISAFDDAISLKPEEIYPQGQIERIKLLIEEKAQADARRERLAAQRQDEASKPKRNNDELSRVNSNSEEQAEQFMRDAREAQEKERYERVKKQKEQFAANGENRLRNSKDVRNAEYAQIAEMKSQSSEQYKESKSIRDGKVKNSVKYKQALMDSRIVERETHDVQTMDAYQNIQKDAERRTDWMTQRESLHDEEIKKYRELKEEQLQRISDWSSASAEDRLKIHEKQNEDAAQRYSENIKADNLRVNRVEVIKEQETEIMEQRAKLSQENLKEIREVAFNNKEAQESAAAKMSQQNADKVTVGAQTVRDQKSRQSTSLNDASSMADKKRDLAADNLKNVQTSEPKAYDDYYRSELAENYPPGVSEESSTLGNKVIITRIVVKGNKGDEYKKVLDKAGNYYFKNGQSISEHTWNRETINAFNSSKD